MGDAGIDPSHGGLAEREGQPEDGVHDQGEDGQAEQPVHEQGVDPIGELARVDPRGGGAHLAQEPVDEAKVALADEHGDVHPGQGFDPLALALCLGQRGTAARQVAEPLGVLAVVHEEAGRQPIGAEDRGAVARQERSERGQGAVHVLAQHQPAGGILGWPARGGDDGGLELLHALPAVTHRLDHREAEKLLHEGQVEALAPGPRLVGHVEAEHRVRPGLHDLREEHEVALELGRVGHHHHHVGRGGQLVPGDPFVGRERAQAVGPGQIHDGERVLRELAGAGASLDGDPGVVGHMLAGARERVEERGLAAVRVARQRHAESRLAELGNGHVGGNQVRHRPLLDCLTAPARQAGRGSTVPPSAAARAAPPGSAPRRDRLQGPPARCRWWSRAERPCRGGAGGGRRPR